VLVQTNPQITLEEKLEFLGRPAAFPDAPDAVEVIETHFAWLFLSRRFVYKLKKPIRFQELDVTTVAARRANCELEVSLNRRLAENVYIGVVPLCADGGRLRLDGAGEAVDWLVHMYRLPGERVLDQAGVHGTVTDAELAALVDKLGAFYRRAARASWDEAEYRRALGGRIEKYAAQFAALDLPFDGDTVRELEALQIAFIRDRAPLFDARIAAERVVDAHGDLRPEHVFLGDDPQIIDCLEFSAALRLLDSAEEIAFLELECERIGCAAVGRRIYEMYRERCADPVPDELYAFYRSLRALVRALLSAWHLDDDLDAPAGARWSAQAQWYLGAGAAAIKSATCAPGSGRE
jgi:aminoglycoside phosphotransferase family enzyme